MGSRKNSNFNKYGFIDIFITLFFLSTAFVCINLFWHDLMQTVNLKNVEPVGTVVIRKNTVQRRFSNRVVWDRLINESPVYTGDLIRVADYSSATLKIKSADIFLEENTLIRIILSPDGETLQIILDEGIVSVVAMEARPMIQLNIDDRQVSAQPGSVLTAAVSAPITRETINTANTTDTAYTENVINTEREISIQTVQSNDWVNYQESVNTPSFSDRQITLISPAANSRYWYHTGTPAIHFQWEELEDAVSYIIEISKTSDFSNLIVNKNMNTPYLVETGLEEGVWFWRVLPVYPSILNTRSIYSNISFFRLEKEAVQQLPDNIMDWLVLEAPTPANLPENLPPEIVSSHFTQEEIAAAIVESPPVTSEAAAETVFETISATPPPPPPPAPPPRLAAPQNMRPARGTRYGTDELQNLRSLNFSWSGVPQANAYIFSLYQQTPSGRRQIVRTAPITRTNYTLEDLRVLDRGTFTWQVEAVRTGEGNSITRRGTTGESTFIFDFQLPGEVQLQVEDLGIQNDE